MSVRDSIARLRKENPDALRDVKGEVTLTEVDGELAPSEFKKLSDQIKRRRLLGDGLAEGEMKSLMNRIGHGRKK